MKQIQFIPSSTEIFNFVQSPISAKKLTPQWYKDIENNYKKSPLFKDDGKLANTNLKMCMPFWDALTAGYIQVTWSDIYISKDSEEKVQFVYSQGPNPLNARSSKHVPTYSNEFYPIEFVWQTPWSLKLPRGYSALVCHPLNRLDLPFVTLNGIIDSDVFSHSVFGNQPFYIKNGFEGLIPAGTPMFQIIPIKREFWESKSVTHTVEQEKKVRQNGSKMWGFYKNNFWQKKEYR